MTQPETRTAIIPSQAVQAWELRQREASAISKSTLLPRDFANNIPNVLIAMEIAERIGASVFLVAQNLDVIYGRPSWRSSFLIATVNVSKRFSPLRFRFSGAEGTDAWGCRAVAKEIADGEECVGARISIGLAKADGWYERKGSKWTTLPEQMLMYRAAAFWTRVYCPELALGLHTTEELADMTLEMPAPQSVPSDIRALEETLRTMPQQTSSMGPTTQAAHSPEQASTPAPPADGSNEPALSPAPTAAEARAAQKRRLEAETARGIQGILPQRERAEGP